jgi:hypothetical protein
MAKQQARIYFSFWNFQKASPNPNPTSPKEEIHHALPHSLSLCSVCTKREKWGSEKRVLLARKIVMEAMGEGRKKDRKSQKNKKKKE